MKSHREAIPKISLEYSLIKSLKKYEIPVIPRMISRVSAIEQNRAIKKTCCLRMPCLRTKAFCAPIAIIRDSPWTISDYCNWCTKCFCSKARHSKTTCFFYCSILFNCRHPTYHSWYYRNLIFL